MIFISHTHADKPIVEPIAQGLASVFGEDSVFYDSWSIQPGDGIVDEMNEALARCEFFFFFVSKKSLVSNMVKLEWQNAVMKATNSKSKLIPVKLDDCLMPPILLQTLYIDIYGQGPENGLRQMIDVVNGASTFRPDASQGYQNIRGYVAKENGDIKIEIRAETYMEPQSKYLILVENSKDQVSFKVIGESMYGSSFIEKLEISDGTVVNAINLNRDTATSPGFPFFAELSQTGTQPIKLIGFMRAVAHDQYRRFPLIEK